MLEALEPFTIRHVLMVFGLFMVSCVTARGVSNIYDLFYRQ
jgi:hypothetical protein